MSIRPVGRHFGCAALVIMLAGCGSAGDQLPPGVAHLRQSPPGRDFDAFLEEATVESERYRRRVLAGGDPTLADADLLAEAVYTREPDNRPEWFSFPLELQVSR